MMVFCSGCEWVRSGGDREVIDWKFWNGLELGNVEGILVGKCQLDLRLKFWTEIWSEIFIWVPDGASRRTFAWR